MLYHSSVGGRVQDRNTTLCLHLLFRHFVFVVVVVIVVFHHKICVSIIFNSFLDEASNFRYRTLTNQKQKFVVEKCQLKLKYSLRLLRRFNFIRYKKQHVRLLLLHCFSILLLNWDIRLPWLCGFQISHRKIRSNTRINMLFQLTSTRLRYHITFTIAVVIQATEK